MSLLSDPPHLCDLYTRSETTDASGGQVVTYTLRVSSVGCLVRGASASEKMIYQQQNINVSHVIASADNRFQEGDKIISNSLTFRTQGIRPQQGVGMIPDWYEVTVEQVV